MAGFCLTGDIFDLFVWFELMGVSAYALTAYRPEERGPVQGALNFAITNSIGAYLSLSGIGLIYGRTGALNMAQIGRDITRHRPDGLVVVAFVLILMGLLIKSAIVPFRFWLADAHAVAPTPVCVLFSGVDAGGGELFGWFGGGGMEWTASLMTGGSGRPPAASASRTASPRPPSAQWSSAVTRRPVSWAACRSVAASMGLTEYASMMRAAMPWSASVSAAVSASCTVMPVATMVTWSLGEERSM